MEWTTLEWTTLEAASQLPGLRLAVVRAGVPSPWTEFCRALFDSRGIPYAQVDARDPATGYAQLKQLTSQESLPVAFWNDERPRTTWFDLVALSERLAMESRRHSERLVTGSPVPSEIDERVTAFGLCDELLGEGGFCWNRRLMLCEQLMRPEATEQERRIGKYLRRKYDSPGRSAAEAQTLCEGVVSHVSALLRKQDERGRAFLVGDALSIADFAWAASAALLRPLPQDDCPLLPLWRDAYTWMPTATSAEDIARLLEHRDRIYREHLRLPVVTG